MVNAVFWLVGELVHLMILAIIAMVILSLLINFGVVDTRNRFVYNIEDFLDRVTRPILMPIRRFLPNFGNLDLSPLLAILLLQALQIALADIYVHIQMAGLDY